MKTLDENICWHKYIKHLQNPPSLKPAHGSQLLLAWSPGIPDCFIKPLWSRGCPRSSPEAWHARPQTQCSRYREYRVFPEGSRALTPVGLSAWNPDSAQVPPLQRSVPWLLGGISHHTMCWPSSHYFSPYFVITYLLQSPYKSQAPVKVPVA